MGRRQPAEASRRSGPLPSTGLATLLQRTLLVRRGGKRVEELLRLATPLAGQWLSCSPNPSSKTPPSPGSKRSATRCCTARTSPPASPAPSAATRTTATSSWSGGCARRSCGSIPTCRPRRWRTPTASSRASMRRRSSSATARVHRMLVDGVTVEYRRKDGSIAGAQARVIDFDDPDNNDWLAVNQFTVVGGPAHAAAGRGAVRQRPAAGGDRAQEPGRRERDGLVGLPAAPDLPGADPGAVRDQRGAGRLRRRAGAHRLARRGQGVVQALAHDHRARGRAAAAAGAAGGAGGRVRAAPLPRPAAPLHRVRGRRAAASSSRRWPATTSSTR